MLLSLNQFFEYLWRVIPVGAIPPWLPRSFGRARGHRPYSRGLEFMAVTHSKETGFFTWLKAGMPYFLKKTRFLTTRVLVII
ncbi:MAG: hypothetical protein EAZ09_19765 [Oscillatoriales cyanobacterium]|nr:MAG: hypothetical protein EAZ09_19765 [Oscillatoriales cyanobacterium]